MQELAAEFKFSDPVSNDGLKIIEIENSMEKLQKCVFSDNTEEVIEMAKKTVALLIERNRKCKHYKKI